MFSKKTKRLMMRNERSMQSNTGFSTKKGVRFSKIIEVITIGEKIDHSCFFLFHHFATRPKDTLPPSKDMVWRNKKKRLNNSQMKVVKKKAVATIELVGAGASLTL